MYQKQKGLVFRVKMSRYFISFKYKELAWKLGAGDEKTGAALHDVLETKGVSGLAPECP
jgi:hypothetical protein